MPNEIKTIYKSAEHDITAEYDKVYKLINSCDIFKYSNSCVITDASRNHISELCNNVCIDEEIMLVQIYGKLGIISFDGKMICESIVKV